MAYLGLCLRGGKTGGKEGEKNLFACDLSIPGWRGGGGDKIVGVGCKMERVPPFAPHP